MSGAAPKDTMYEYVKNKRSEVKKTKKPYVYPADARVSSGRWHTLYLLMMENYKRPLRRSRSPDP